MYPVFTGECLYPPTTYAMRSAWLFTSFYHKPSVARVSPVGTVRVPSRGQFRLFVQVYLIVRSINCEFTTGRSGRTPVAFPPLRGTFPGNIGLDDRFGFPRQAHISQALHTHTHTPDTTPKRLERIVCNASVVTCWFRMIWCGRTDFSRSIGFDRRLRTRIIYNGRLPCE